MTRPLLLGLVLALSAVGCFTPVAEYSPAPPSGRDAGPDAGQPAAPDAGPHPPDASALREDAARPGPDASSRPDASAPRDAGLVVFSDDAGLIPTLPPLEETLCRTRPLPAAECPVEGGCFMLLSKGGAAEVLVSLRDLDAAQAWVVHATDEQVLLQLRRSFAKPGPERLVAVNLATRVVTELDSQPPAQNVLYAAAATSLSYGTWVVRGTGPTANVRKYDLLLSVGGGAALGAMPGIPRPTTRGAAVGTDYLVGHEGALASYYPAGGGTVVALPASEQVTDLAALSASTVFFLVNQAKGPASELRRYRRNGDTATLAQIPEGLGSLALIGETVYALGGQGLLEVAPEQSPRWRYRGELFPQHAGTLAPRSLVARGGKLYLGQICHFDADAPEYGTVELDPVRGTARWLEEDPDYPFVGAPVAHSGWGEPPSLVDGKLLVFAP